MLRADGGIQGFWAARRLLGGCASALSLLACGSRDAPEPGPTALPEGVCFRISPDAQALATGAVKADPTDLQLRDLLWGELVASQRPPQRRRSFERGRRGRSIARRGRGVLDLQEQDD
jgi:hypothetical protein